MNAERVVDVGEILDQGISKPQIRVLLLCAAVVFLDGFDTQVIGYIAPSIAKQWSLPRAALGPIFSAGLVGLMIGFLALSPLSDKVGRRKMIVTSTLMFGLFTLLTATASNPWTLGFCRLLTGIGLGGAMPNALALAGEFSPKNRRASCVVYMFCGFSLGSIASGILASALMNSFGWQSVLIVGGALPLAASVALWTWLPESLLFMRSRIGREIEIKIMLRNICPTLPAEFTLAPLPPLDKGTALPVFELFRNGLLRDTLLIWTVFFMNLLILYFLQSWLPTIFTDMGFSMEKAILTTTLTMAGGIVSALATGPLMDRFGPYPVLAGLFGLGAVFVGLIGVASLSFVALMIIVFCAGFCVSGAQKSANAMAAVFYPTEIRATGIGWSLGVGRVGSIIGPSAVGLLMSHGFSINAIFAFASVPLGVAAIASLSLYPSSRGGAKVAGTSSRLTMQTAALPRDNSKFV